MPPFALLIQLHHQLMSTFSVENVPTTQQFSVPRDTSSTQYAAERTSGPLSAGRFSRRGRRQAASEPPPPAARRIDRRRRQTIPSALSPPNWAALPQPSPAAGPRAGQLPAHLRPLCLVTGSAPRVALLSQTKPL